MAVPSALAETDDAAASADADVALGEVDEPLGCAFGGGKRPFWGGWLPLLPLFGSSGPCACLREREWVDRARRGTTYAVAERRPVLVLAAASEVEDDVAATIALSTVFL